MGLLCFWFCTLAEYLQNGIYTCTIRCMLNSNPWIWKCLLKESSLKGKGIYFFPSFVTLLVQLLWIRLRDWLFICNNSCRKLYCLTKKNFFVKFVQGGNCNITLKKKSLLTSFYKTAAKHHRFMTTQKEYPWKLSLQHYSCEWSSLTYPWLCLSELWDLLDWV